MKYYTELSNNYIDGLYEKTREKLNIFLIEIIHSIILMMNADKKNVYVLTCLLNAKNTNDYEEFLKYSMNETTLSWLDSKFNEIVQSNEEIKIEKLFSKLLEDTIYEQKTIVRMLKFFYDFISQNDVIYGTLATIFDEYNEAIGDAFFEYSIAFRKFEEAVHKRQQGTYVDVHTDDF